MIVDAKFRVCSKYFPVGYYYAVESHSTFEAFSGVLVVFIHMKRY